MACISKRNHFDDDHLRKNQGYYKYSLSVGIIGFLFSLFLIIWIRINIYISNKEGDNSRDIRSGDDENNDVQDQDQQQEQQQEQEQQGGQQDLLSTSSQQKSNISLVDKYRWLINGILFIWSLFGVMISTFEFYINAFNATGNGT